MSWRTQGQYKGFEKADAAWLQEFDRKWERKDQGRIQTDAMDYIVQGDGLEKQAAPKEENDPFSIEALLISTGARIARIAVPRPTKLGWLLTVVLTCGKRTRICFTDSEAASQAYLAVCEFFHWFQPLLEPVPEKQQEDGSPPRLSGSPLTARPAPAPREKGPSHLAACPPQNTPSRSVQPPSPVSRPRLS